MRSFAIIFPKWKLSIGCSGDFFSPSRYDCSALRGLADRLLDRAQGVVEFAGQHAGIHSLLNATTISRASRDRSRYECRIHALLFTASIEFGWAASTMSYCATALAKVALASGGAGFALGDREQKIAQVDVSGRRVELGCRGFGVRQCHLELLRLVQADRDCKAHAALNVAGGQLGGDSLRFRHPRRSDSVCRLGSPRGFRSRARPRARPSG